MFTALRRERRIWLCECKYTKKTTGIKLVEKLEQAAQAVKQETENSEYPSEIMMWLVSTGGFTREVLRYLWQCENDFRTPEKLLVL